MLRMAAFKEETIHIGMLIEDYVLSGEAVANGKPKMIYSIHFPERDMNNKWDKFVGWVQFTWYVQARPIGLKLVALVTALCALIVIISECTFYFAGQKNYL